MKTWQKLGNNEYKEEGVTVTEAMRATIELLCELESKVSLNYSLKKEIIWEFARWVFDINAEESLQIFTSTKRKLKLHPDDVLEFLVPYGMKQNTTEKTKTKRNETKQTKQNKPNQTKQTINIDKNQNQNQTKTKSKSKTKTEETNKTKSVSICRDP